MEEVHLPGNELQVQAGGAGGLQRSSSGAGEHLWRLKVLLEEDSSRLLGG